MDVFEKIISNDDFELAKENVNDANDDGLTALHVATLHRNKTAVEKLLALGAKVGAKTKKMISNVDPIDNRRIRPGSATFWLPTGNEFLPEGVALDKAVSALHIASMLGNSEIVTLLLDHKAKPSLLDGAGATPLHHAARYGNSNAVELLLATGKCKIEQATKLRKSATFYDVGTTALHAALESGNFDCVEKLLAAGADIHAKTKIGCSAIFFAARGGDPKAMKQVLDAVAVERGTYENDPLIEAIENGHTDVVALLLQAGAESENAKKPMWTATEHDFLDIRKLLVKAGYERLQHRNIVDAARSNDTTFIKAFKGDLDEVINGSTALMNAAAKRYYASAKMLIDRGANPNANPNGTAMHWAISNNAEEILDLLLQAGADCSLQDANGNNVLFAAALNRRFLDRIPRMIELGGDPYLHNKHGNSAYLVAKRDNIVALLEHFEGVKDETSHLYAPFEDPKESAVLTNGARKNWKELHAALWEELVPPSGPCGTVQGELVRCIGRLTDEAYRNGNINFDDRHRAWIKFIETTLTDGSFDRAWEEDVRQHCIALRKNRQIDTRGDGSPHYLLNEAVISWCLKHPDLITRTVD